MLEGFQVELHTLPFLGEFMEIEADEEKLEKFLPKIGFSVTDGINKDYTQLFYGFCSEHGLSMDTPQTFEEEKLYLQKK